MPFTYLEIEERKNRILWLLFLFLVFLYFLGIYLLVVALRAAFPFFGLAFTKTVFLFSRKETFEIIFFAVIVAAFHWTISTLGMAKKILNTLEAKPPDPEDTYHQAFQNIVEEVSIATGKRGIEGVCLPSVALNAFSISDFRGRAVIGVTEGLLSRLNRSQLEAVVGHEAAHIVAGDTLLTTISVSLFGVYGALMRGLEKGAEALSDDRGRAAFSPIGLAVYCIAACMYFLTKLVGMFISRECEYRADATAVRLVRDPLTLAQSLYLIHRKWRGGGLGYEFMESIFIFNPNYSQLDEQEGFISNLFSTHPPVARRINALLAMAHTDFDTLAQETSESVRARTQGPGVSPILESRWYVAQGIRWLGPFSPLELMDLNGLTYDTFVRSTRSDKITMLYENRELADMFRGQQVAYAQDLCPRCGKGLEKVTYEGVPVHTCLLCRGVLLEKGKLPRIISRQDQGFSPEVVRQAAVIEEMMKKYAVSFKVKAQPGLGCSRCKSPMVTGFYSLVYPIEVERCFYCNTIWFDRYELEVLQYLIEKACDKPEGGG